MPRTEWRAPMVPTVWGAAWAESLELVPQMQEETATQEVPVPVEAEVAPVVAQTLTRPVTRTGLRLFMDRQGVAAALAEGREQVVPAAPAAVDPSVSM